MKKKTQLEQYLEKHTHTRESIINNKILFDLKLASARAEYFINVYTPEVDQDGFDMIFDDHDKLAKIQLKTVTSKAKTNAWDIHKGLLRPEPYLAQELGFEFSPEGTGYQGGIVLIEIEDFEDNGFEVKYYYTDILIICAMRDHILKLSKKPKKTTLKTFFKDIGEGASHEKIKIYKNMFLEAKNPDALLALMGMHNQYSREQFRYNLQKVIEPCDNQQLVAPRDRVIDSINQDLYELSHSIEVV